VPFCVWGSAIKNDVAKISKSVILCSSEAEGNLKPINQEKGGRERKSFGVET